MKKGIIVGVIIGILLSGVAVYATGGKLTADSVSYNKTTVKASLDNLFNDVENGKAKIAEAITNKGVETSSTASYDKMVSNINSISTGTSNADKTLYQALKYSGIVTEDMTFEEMTKALENYFPEKINFLDPNRTWKISSAGNTTSSSRVSVTNESIEISVGVNSSGMYYAWATLENAVQLGSNSILEYVVTGGCTLQVSTDGSTWTDMLKITSASSNSISNEIGTFSLSEYSNQKVYLRIFAQNNYTSNRATITFTKFEINI
jgi:hypothetical protein